jgi:flagellar assembly protein FliH
LLSRARILSVAASEAPAEAFVYRSAGDNHHGGSYLGLGLPSLLPDAPASPLQEPEDAPAPSPSFTEEEVKIREAAAWRKGSEEATQSARAEHEKTIAAEQSAIANALEEFAQERSRYYDQAEGEVINLTLAITRKILQREAQVDPLLLRGLVKVALEKVSDGTFVKLHVAPDRVALWRETFSAEEIPGAGLEVIGDGKLEQGHVVVETELGSTDLSVESKLKEIERGFMDLLASRPEKR